MTLRMVFYLPLRQTEGFLDSLLRLMELDLKAPDHTTLSRYQAKYSSCCPCCAPQKVDPALIARVRPAAIGCFVPADPTMPSPPSRLVASWLSTMSQREWDDDGPSGSRSARFHGQSPLNLDLSETIPLVSRANCNCRSYMDAAILIRQWNTFRCSRSRLGTAHERQ